MFFIDDILLAPLAGLKFVMNQIQKVADQELNDESVIKEQLLELQMRLELGEIEDDDFVKAEAELFSRLRAIKSRQLEMLGQIHTAESSSFSIELSGDESDEESPFGR
jgi:hypothetical protein